MKSIAGWEDNRDREQPEGPRSQSIGAKQQARPPPRAAAKKPARMYRTNLRDVPKVGGPQAQGRLGRHAGAVPDRQEIRRRRSCGGLDRAEARRRHENHLHHNCDEFFIVLKGKGHIYTEQGRGAGGRRRRGLFPRAAGTDSTTPRTRTSCWCGAGWAPAPSRRRATRSNPRGSERAALPWSIAHRPGTIRSSGRIRASCAACRRSSRRGASVLTAATSRRAGRWVSARRRCWSFSTSPAPLVGFLTRNARVQSGGSVSFAGWSKPVVEPEIAVHIGRDVPAGADRDTAERRDRRHLAGDRDRGSHRAARGPRAHPRAATSTSATWCSAARTGARRRRSGRADLPHHSPRYRVCAHERSAGRIPVNGSTSSATSPICWRLSASVCVRARSSSPARWCRR